MAQPRIPEFHPANPQPHGDTTLTKIFVGGLAWETRSDALRHYFEQFGEVLEAAVVLDKSTGRSKGYGFVTFRDPESAKRACADPTPLIDGRWANCNLASLGRPQLIQLYGHLKPANSFVGGLPIVLRNYQRSFQQPLPYGYYQQGYTYPTYGHATYDPKYLISPEVHNPYAGHQYVPMYGAPCASSPTMYQYGSLGQTVPTGHGYSAMQGYMMSGHHMMQPGGLGVNGIPTSTFPLLQASYPTALSGNAAAIPAEAEPQYVFAIPPVIFSNPAQIVG